MYHDTRVPASRRELASSTEVRWNIRRRLQVKLMSDSCLFYYVTLSEVTLLALTSATTDQAVDRRTI